MLLSTVSCHLSLPKVKYILEVYLNDRGYKEILKTYEKQSIYDIAECLQKDVRQLDVMDIINYIADKVEDKVKMGNSLMDYLISYISENSMNNVVYSYSKCQKIEDMIKQTLNRKGYFPSDAGLAAIHLDFTEKVFQNYRSRFQDTDSMFRYLANAFSNFYMKSFMPYIKKHLDKRSETLKNGMGESFSVYDKIATDELDKREPNYNIPFKEDVRNIYAASFALRYGDDKEPGEDFLYDIFSTYKLMYAEKRWNRFRGIFDKYFYIKCGVFFDFIDKNFIIVDDPNNFRRRTYMLRKNFILHIKRLSDNLSLEEKFQIIYQNGDNEYTGRANVTAIFKGVLKEDKQLFWLVVKAMKCSEHLINNLNQNNIDLLSIESLMFRTKVWQKYTYSLEQYIKDFDSIREAVILDSEGKNGDNIFDDEAQSKIKQNRQDKLAIFRNKSLNDMTSTKNIDILGIISNDIFKIGNISEYFKTTLSNYEKLLTGVNGLNGEFIRNQSTQKFVFKDNKFGNYIGNGYASSEALLNCFEVKKSYVNRRKNVELVPKIKIDNQFKKLVNFVTQTINKLWINNIALQYDYNIDDRRFLFDGIRALSVCAFISINTIILAEKIQSAKSILNIVDVMNEFRDFLGLFEKTPSYRDLKILDTYNQRELVSYGIDASYTNGIVTSCLPLAENGILENEEAVMNSIISVVFKSYRGAMSLFLNIKDLVDKETYMFRSSLEEKLDMDKLKEISDSLICHPYVSDINAIRTKYLSKVNEYGYFCLSDGKLVTKKIMNRTYYLHEKGYWVCPEKGLDDLIIYHQN